MANFLHRDDYAPGRWLRPELIAPWWEIVLVLTVMLGPFAYSSLHYALRSHSYGFARLMANDFHLLRNVAIESGLLSCMMFYLRWRGWTPADLRIRIDWKGTLLMPVVAIGAMLANVITALGLNIWVIAVAPHPHGMAAAFVAQTHHIPRHSVEVTWAMIFIGSIVNAYLEELVFMSYAFHQLAAKYTPIVALLCMVFLRMLLHTYKGPINMLGIAAFSFVFGAAYIYLRRLWPLILGHACIDVAAFSALKILFGR